MTGRSLAAAVVTLFVVLSALIVPASAAPTRPRPDTDFTLVVIPDTQLAVQNQPELFFAQTHWILRHRHDWNIPFVLQVGDLVQQPERRSDWQRATTALHPLNNQVPYAIAVGNHDLDAWACQPAANCDPWESIAADRRASRFNAHFPRSMFAPWPSFGGSHPDTGMDNSYFHFTAASVDWLVITLKYQPTEDELAWAEHVISAHPRHQVILGTHDYQGGTSRTAAGEQIWHNLLRRHPNVQFVFSGHHVAAGTRTDRGDHGNLVYQIQADYQTADPDHVTENSYLRLLEFDIHAGTLSVSTFSPHCATSGGCPAYKTDPANQFVLTGVEFPAGQH